MLIEYNPLFCKLTDTPSSVIDFISSSYYAEITTELVNYYKTPQNLPVFLSSNGFFCSKEDSIYVYSGFIKDIYTYACTVTSVKLIIKDNCKSKTINNPLPSFLYSHQELIIKRCLKHKRGIIKSPTGSGKSMCIATLSQLFIDQGLSVLITVPTLTLQRQMLEDIKKYYELCNKEVPSIGMVSSAFSNSSFGSITIGLIPSLLKEQYISSLADIDVLITDECHTAINRSCLTILERCLQRSYTLGFSATPWLNNVSHYLLQGFFGNTFVDIKEQQMIQQEVIMEPQFVFYKSPTTFIPPRITEASQKISSLSQASKFHMFNAAYDFAIVNNRGRNKLICTIAKKMIDANSGPLLIIVKKIKGENSHGELLQNMMSSMGIDLPILSGYTKKKDKQLLLESLKNESLPGCIAGPKIISAGVSINSLSCIILAAAGKSDTDFIQRVGRLLRKKQGKTRPLVVDFYDTQLWFSRHSQNRIDTAKSTYGLHNVIINN